MPFVFVWVSIAGAADYEELQLHADEAAEYFGIAIDGGADIDGDGIDDLAVGAYGRKGIEPTAFVFLGGSNFLDPLKVDPTESAGSFGYSVGVGDVDGDGHGDLIVGSLAEKVFVYFGTDGGLDLARTQVVTASDGESGDSFGRAVAAVGDLDADGYGDIAVNAWSADVNRGRVYVYYGSADGVDPSREDVFLPSTSLGASNFFGQALSRAGDVDADGYADFLVGSPGDSVQGTAAGAAFLVHGGSTGADASRVTRLEGLNADAYDYFGFSVVGAGDLDGDGFDDVAVGAEMDAERAEAGGSVTIFYGGAGGISTGRTEALYASDIDYWWLFGETLAGPGDLDGDGYADLVVGARTGNYDLYTGAVYVYGGGPGGIEAASEIRLTASDAEMADRYAMSMGRTGDVDADGLPEFAVGAYLHGSGAAYLYGVSCTDEDDDEVCAGADCDDTDEAVGGPTPWYVDEDNDGYGSGKATEEACGPGAGLSAVGGDCDDTDPSRFPGATEVEGDGIDQDCDGTDATGPADTGDGPADTGEPAADEPTEGDDAEPKDEGCGCGTRTGAPGAWIALLVAAACVRRVRR